MRMLLLCSQQRRSVGSFEPSSQSFNGLLPDPQSPHPQPTMRWRHVASWVFLSLQNAGAKDRLHPKWQHFVNVGLLLVVLVVIHGRRRDVDASVRTAKERGSLMSWMDCHTREKIFRSSTFNPFTHLSFLGICCTNIRLGWPPLWFFPPLSSPYVFHTKLLAR